MEKINTNYWQTMQDNIVIIFNLETENVEAKLLDSEINKSAK
jgi:hypothetical protein